MKKVLSIVCLLAIVASCLFVFASCGGGATPNADMATAKASLEAAGYTVYENNNVLIASNGSEYAEITYCTNESEAETKYQQNKSLYDALELAEQYGGGENTKECGKSGTVTWLGTPAAIEASAGK